MANDLTGDFDVVAEFAVPAVNRVLATMHRLERFPHSMALRVDDTHPPGPGPARPSVVATVDAFGDTVVNHRRIGNTEPLSGLLTATDPAFSLLDGIVNPDLLGASREDIIPSNLKGRAQLQLFAPTIEVADASGTNVTVRIELISRYFPDPHTSPAAEFVRGDLAITAPVAQVASQSARVVHVDIKADTVRITFTTHSSSRPLVAEDRAAIIQLIRNALKTSFLPSSSDLPSDIAHVQFKTLLGAHNAVAVMLDMEGGAGNPASLHNVFLGGGDDFAFAAGRDFVLAAFQPTIQGIMTRDHRGPPESLPLSYKYLLESATVDLHTGEIVLTIKGYAHSPHWYAPNFHFTVRQHLTLQASGATANLVVGAISIDTDSIIADLVKGRILDAVRKRRDDALEKGDARKTVRDLLNADDNLGKFLDPLLRPAGGHEPANQPRAFKLSYNSVEIRPSGIVLHGSVSVMPWPAAHVQFEQIPAGSHGHGDLAGTVGVVEGPDYSALKSWIPGGTVHHYEWKQQGQTQPGFTDENRFVFLHQPPGLIDAAISTTPVSDGTHVSPTLADAGFSTNPIPGYVPLCLTVHGSRLSPTGAAVAQPVTATVCGYNSFPIVNGLEGAESIPFIALAQPGPRGLVEVTGHTAARVAEVGNRAPNLIVHFADETSADRLEVLSQALREGGRTDAATAILVIMPPELLAKARYTEGVIYSEDDDKAWERRFGAAGRRRPMTLIVGPNGKVAWQYEGAVDTATLAAALRKNLVVKSPIQPGVLPAAVRIGHRPPNFLFEHAPGNETTLRKLGGRPTTLVFWKSSSKPSIEAVRDQQATIGKYREDQPKEDQPVVLAINDGDASDLAKKTASANGISATVVVDPKRSISLAYGVSIWPTTISIDALGDVSSIGYGRRSDAHVDSPSPEQSAR